MRNDKYRGHGATEHSTLKHHAFSEASSLLPRHLIQPSALVKGIAALTGGHLLARLVALVVLPLNTRIFDASDFGVLSLVSATLVIAIPLVTGAYAIGVPLPKKDEDALGLLKVSFLLLCVGVALLWIFATALDGTYRVPPALQDIATYKELIAAALFVAGVYELLSYWCMRRRRYTLTAKINLSQALIGGACTVGAGLLVGGPIGLLAGLFAKQLTGALSYIVAFRRDLVGIMSVSRDNTWKTAKAYCVFPTIRLPAQLLLTASQQAPIILFAALYGAKSTGYLGLALTVLALPMSLLGQAVSKAYYGEAATLYHSAPSRLYSLTIRLVGGLFLAAVLPGAVVFFLGESIFSAVFGGDWRLSGEYASILSISLVFQLATAPVTGLLTVINKQAQYLFINLARISGVLAIFVGGAKVFELAESSVLFVYSIFMSGIYCTTLAVIGWGIKTSPRLAS